MDIIKATSYCQLANLLLDLCSEGKIVSCAMDYEKTKILFTELIRNEDVVIDNVYLEDEYMHGYCREFYLTIDENYHVSVEKAYRMTEFGDGIYLFNYADIHIFDGEASSSIICGHENDECYELRIVDDNSEGNTYCDHNECSNCCGDCCDDCSSCTFVDKDDEEVIDYVELIMMLLDELN